MFKKFISFTKGYRIFTVLTPILVFIDAFIEIQLPKIMGNVVNEIYEVGTAGTGPLYKNLLMMLGFCLLTLLIGYIAARCSAVASVGFATNMKKELFNKVQDLSFENIDQLKISSLITRMTSDVSMITSMFTNIIVTFVKGPYILILALYTAISYSKELSQVFYVVVPTVIITLSLMGYLLVPLFKDMLKKTDKFNAVVRGNINGIRVVKAFVREEYEKEKFNEANTAIAKANIRAQNLVLYISPAFMLIIYGCLVFTLYRGSGLIFAGDIKIGTLTAFTNYITQVISSLMTILMAFVTIIMARASVSRVSEIFKAEPTITDVDGDENLSLSDGSVEFRNVHFKYNLEAEEDILENVSFKINSGETVGIIGATGSAKSTIVQLIPRLYDVYDGEVIVGGSNVKNYKFLNLRKDISIVMQQNVLFSGTIKDNIRWGRRDATDEEVIEAAKDAQAHDFILEQTDGYDTELGQGGNTVSGGQRQRLCIARALLKKAKILILDDSTSAVDTSTDSRIKAALRQEKYAGITKIIVAQRITSIMDADRIIVVENGRINGIGTHDELKNSNEIYKEIFMSQQEGVLASE